MIEICFFGSFTNYNHPYLIVCQGKKKCFLAEILLVKKLSPINKNEQVNFRFIFIVLNVYFSG